jgi:hypothetical protein
VIDAAADEACFALTSEPLSCAPSNLFESVVAASLGL